MGQYHGVIDEHNNPEYKIMKRSEYVYLSAIRDEKKANLKKKALLHAKEKKIKAILTRLITLELALSKSIGDINKDWGELD